MPVFGIDISHHQGAFDLARAAREGMEFFILKATEGSGFTDPRFAENLKKARATGKVHAAYHYQQAGPSAAAQVEHVTRVVPKDVPVIPDVEANSGNIALTRDIVNRLRRAGYRVPLVYLPRWYWQRIGSPSLAGLPPLWSSRYPDMAVGDIRAEYKDVPAHYWDGYGGLRVEILQFTSSARVAGREPIDGNAFRGNLAQLRTLFAAQGGDDMPLTNDDLRKLHDAVWHGVAGAKLINVREPGRPDGWAEYVLGSMSDWIIRQQLAPMRQQIRDLTNLIAKQADVSADDIAQALRAGLSADLLPVLRDAVGEALGADNAAQADEIAERVLDKLGAKLTATE